MAILDSEGFDALTIARLAKQVDGAVGALYRYFPSKEALLLAMQLRALDAYVDMARTLLSRPVPWAGTVSAHAGALGEVLRAVAVWVAWRENCSIEHRLVDQIISEPRTLFPGEEARDIFEATGRVGQLYEARLDAAAEVGALEPGDGLQRTWVLWSALHGLDHFRKLGRVEPDRVGPVHLRRATIDALLLGWGAEPTALREARAVVDEEVRTWM